MRWSASKPDPVAASTKKPDCTSGFFVSTDRSFPGSGLTARSIQFPPGILDITTQLLPLLGRQALRTLCIPAVLPPIVLTAFLGLTVCLLSLKAILTASIADQRAEIPRSCMHRRHRKTARERDADCTHHPLEKLRHGRPPRSVRITRDKIVAPRPPDHPHFAPTRAIMKHNDSCRRTKRSLHPSCCPGFVNHRRFVNNCFRPLQTLNG